MRLNDRQIVGLHLGLAALMTAAVAGLMLLRGPMPVTQSAWSLPHRASATYMVLAFPLFGSLCAELAVRWLNRRPLRWLLLQTALLCVFATLRLTTGFPASGHVMLAVFYVIVAPTFGPFRRPALVFGWALLAWFCLIKVHYWGDLVTPTAGATLGVIVAALPRVVDGITRGAAESDAETSHSNSIAP